jgi:hypothetical protein
MWYNIGGYYADAYFDERGFIYNETYMVTCADDAAGDYTLPWHVGIGFLRRSAGARRARR